jgi:hypothetical protein
MMTADLIRLPATLPPVPSDLAGWAWEADPFTRGAVVRLTCAAEGEATDWQPPSYAEAMITAARAVAARDAAAVAEVRAEAGTARGDPFRLLAPAQIRRDGGTQARVGNHEEVVEAYTAAMQDGRWQWHDGNRLVVVFDGTDYWLADGFHRAEAAQRAGRATVPCDVRPGSRRDAVLLACGANADHGLRRTADDIRRAIRTLLRDPEWVRWSNREIARHARADDKTVAAVRRELEAGAEIPHLTARVGTDGKVYAARARQAGPIALPPTTPARVAPPAPPPPDSIAAICTGLDRLQGHVEAGRTTAGDLAALDALAARLDGLGDRYPGAEDHIAALRQALAPPPAPAAAVPERQPSGAAGAGRGQPIVPHVLIIAPRPGLYAPPPLTRAATMYATATTVRCRPDAGAELTQHQHLVWCLPDEAAWAEAQALHAAFAERLTALAAALRQAGRYDQRLAANGGIKAQPSPLCLSVAVADDPDAPYPSTWWLTPWHVPSVERRPVERHTPKMLSAGGIGSDTFPQDGAFVLGDDATWTQIHTAWWAVQEAAELITAFLMRLGTYQEAVADGRYQRGPVAPIAPVAVIADTSATWNALEDQLIAAAQRLIANLPAPQCRVLAALLGTPEDAGQALTAPLPTVQAAFQRVAAATGAGVIQSAADAAAVRQVLAELKEAA